MGYLRESEARVDGAERMMCSSADIDESKDAALQLAVGKVMSASVVILESEKSHGRSFGDHPSKVRRPPDRWFFGVEEW